MREKENSVGVLTVDMSFGVLADSEFNQKGEEMRELNVLEKYILLLLNANDGEPIQSMLHLESMIFLCARNDPELQEYLDSHSSR